MKPTCYALSGKKRFPLTVYFFQSGLGDWHSHWPAPDGDDESEIRKFHEFSRELLLESARDRAKEMAVFAVVILTALWPIIYMVVSVVKLLNRQ